MCFPITNLSIFCKYWHYHFEMFKNQNLVRCQILILISTLFVFGAHIEIQFACILLHTWSASLLQIRKINLFVSFLLEYYLIRGMWGNEVHLQTLLYSRPTRSAIPYILPGSRCYIFNPFCCDTVEYMIKVCSN